MKADEYMDLARKEEQERRQNPNQYDLYSYTYVWLKSRQPDLAKELEEFACSNDNWVYHHSWEVGDAVIWDNRCLMHQASMWDLNEGRIMYHSRIEGDPISEAASNYL